jgi:hypothetical protein
MVAAVEGSRTKQTKSPSTAAGANSHVSNSIDPSRQAQTNRSVSIFEDRDRSSGHSDQTLGYREVVVETAEQPHANSTLSSGYGRTRGPPRPGRPQNGDADGTAHGAPLHAVGDRDRSQPSPLTWLSSGSPASTAVAAERLAAVVSPVAASEAEVTWSAMHWSVLAKRFESPTLPGGMAADSRTSRLRRW